MQLAANREDLELTLFDGYSQEIPRDNTTELQRLYFRTDLVKVRGVATGFSRTADKGYKSDREMTICEMQSEVHRAARDLKAANTDLANAMGNAAYYLATGETRPLEASSPDVRVWSLAQAYCNYVVPVFRVDEAQAAEPPLPDDGLASSRQAVRQSGGAVTDSAGRLLPETVRRALPPTFRGSQGTPQPVTEQPVLTGSTEALGRIPAVDPYVIAHGQLQAASSRIQNSRMDLNQYQVEIEKKFALAAACLVFVLLGAPMALRFPRGGVGLVIGASLSVFGLYYVGLIAGETLADKLIVSPFVAMWMANILFTIAGFVFLYMLRRSGSTTRGGDFGEMWDALRARLSRRSSHTTPALAERRSVAS
jgi:lipopolysaccharide export system permease protein